LIETRVPQAEGSSLTGLDLQERLNGLIKDLRDNLKQRQVVVTKQVAGSRAEATPL